ncbi:MAG: FmdB family zinc ribbon protein [Halanaerobiaceae bacterium]
MPVYKYRCQKCDFEFEEFFFTFKQAKTELDCPKCEGKAKKVFTAPSISTSRTSIDKQFSDDPKEYREMHYHEKQGNWRKAAKAADGVSDYAKNKFLSKARQEESK